MNYEVSPEHLQDVWPECRHWIERALEYGPGDEQLSDVFLGIARGMYALWHSPGEFAAVYQVMRYPRQTVVTVVYAGGDDLSAIKKAWDYAHWECARRGVDVVRMWGRSGWEKALGVKRIGVVMQTRVTLPAEKQVPMQEARIQ